MVRVGNEKIHFRLNMTICDVIANSVHGRDVPILDYPDDIMFHYIIQDSEI